MKPELSPPSGVRNAGSPSESDGFVSRSTRRSEMFASSAIAIASASSAKASGWPWKFPFETSSRGLDEDDRVVGRGVQLDADDALRVGDQVAARAVHLRRAAERVGVLHLVAPAVRLDDRRALDEPQHVRGRRPPGPGTDAAPGSPAETRRASPGAPRARARTRCPPTRRGAAPARQPSAPIAHMNCVPLMSESPSFACSRTGSSPTRASAVAPGQRARLPRSRLPRRRAEARGARAARGRPTRRPTRGSGRGGRTPRFRHSTRSSTVSTRAPDVPFASAFARRSIAARTTSSGYGSPTPHAWLRRSRSWSSSDSSGGIVRSTKRPKPVLIP